MDGHEGCLRSSYYTPSQLLALGRISELSALLEVLLRQVLQQAIGVGNAAGEALFLGDRASTLADRIKALGEFADMPGWVRDEAVVWAGRARDAIENRNDLLHRAPAILTDDNDDLGLVGWNRSRRKHHPLPIDEVRLLKLVEELARLEAEAMHKLMWDWTTSVTDGDDASE